MSKTYRELSRLSDYQSRFEYLILGGAVGATTFGVDRYLNQELYRSKEWLYARDQVIFRDNGCDMGVPGFEIRERIVVHHMNPITLDDIQNRNSNVFNPEFLISVAPSTHLAIHYGNTTMIQSPTQRFPGDTCPWK